MKNLRYSVIHLLCILSMMMLSPVTTASQERESLPSLAGDENMETMVIHDAKMIERSKGSIQPIGIRYTKKHPLIIVADWVFKPYAYINDNGEPDGFQVQLIKNIFERMHVAHELHMMEWKAAKRELVSGRAHLMIDIYKNDRVHNVTYGRTSLAPYQVGVIHRKSVESIRSILLLKSTDTIYVNKNDYAHVYLKTYFHDNIPCHVECLEPTEALQGVVNGKVKYYVWGMASINALVNKLGIRNEVYVDGIDIPDGTFRFTSSDPELLHEIDKLIIEMKESGAYQKISDQWLSGNYVSEKNDNLTEIIIVVSVFIIIVTVILIIVLYYRSGSSSELKHEFQKITQMAVGLTNCHIFIVNIRKMWTYNVSSDFIPEKGLSIRQFDMLIHPEDIKTMYDIRARVDSGERNLPDIIFRMHKHDDEKKEWRAVRVSATVKSNRRGKPLYLYLTMSDETERIEEENNIDRAMREYASVMDIPDIGMMYYNSDGSFVNANKGIEMIFQRGGVKRVEEYLQKTNLQDMPFIGNGITLEENMQEWFCSKVEIPELNLRSEMEVRIQSIYDDKMKHRGYTISICDITDYIEQRMHYNDLDRRFQSVKESLKYYQMELRFTLRNNKMSTFRWKKGSDRLEVSRDLLSFDSPMTLKEFYELLSDEFKESHRVIVERPQDFFSIPRNEILSFNDTKKGASVKHWFLIMTIPEHDEKGTLTGVFGIRRDISDQQNTLEKLKEETSKAQDSNRQKALFLANMTHELRTPLNAINGFAEILLLTCSQEEKTEFSNIMIQNCNQLIVLVDNILQLSMMDIDGVKLKPKKKDFAMEFHNAVLAMKHYITSPQVKLIIDRSLVTLPLDIDMEKVMQVVDAFVNNAAKFTKAGYIRVGYRYNDGKLTVYCRDTGCGIPPEEQKNVFKRFVKLDNYVQGTGLGLTVSKIIVDSMKGTMDLYSKVGEGTVLSFTIPVKPVNTDSERYAEEETPYEIQ